VRRILLSGEILQRVIKGGKHTIFVIILFLLEKMSFVALAERIIATKKWKLNRTLSLFFINL